MYRLKYVARNLSFFLHECAVALRESIGGAPRTSLCRLHIVFPRRPAQLALSFSRELWAPVGIVSADEFGFQFASSYRLLYSTIDRAPC